MAHQENLEKIGVEGFKFAEVFFPGPRGPTTSQEPYPEGRNQVAPNKQVPIDFNQAAKKYGGVVIIEGRKKVPPYPKGRNQVAPNKQVPNDFNQATKKYGGVIIIEGHKKVPHRY